MLGNAGAGEWQPAPWVFEPHSGRGARTRAWRRNSSCAERGRGASTILILIRRVCLLAEKAPAACGLWRRVYCCRAMLCAGSVFVIVCMRCPSLRLRVFKEHCAV